MNTKLKQSILFAGFSVAMLTAASSFAANSDGPYVSGNLGASFSSSSNWNLPTNTGWTGGAAIGSKSGPYALEFAVDYLTNKVRDTRGFDWPITTALPLTATGRISASTFFVNGFYDFLPEATWTPYVGAGLGLASLSIGVNATDNLMGGARPQVHQNRNQLAYQAIAGASWKVAEGMTADLDYRYVRTANASVNATYTDGNNVSQTTALRSRYTSNRFTLGLTKSFD